MSVTQIDLDDDVLAAAMRLMGASTKKETVNTALREYVRRVERLQAAEALAARGARGEFDDAAAAHQAAKKARKTAAERGSGATNRGRGSAAA
ncbi:type II toxin-antitoxin system VapB family antitoxin [Streptomyces sp. NPDC002133]|uniref:type II toxin-antitoxin system VapB family antitoxin n=1 Tax=Streptomyces sp. NPDC002133 TaxID=3154409 RepID=UPI0033296B8E